MISAVHRCQAIYIGSAHFVVTFRTLDGGGHRFEIDAPDYFAAKTRAGWRIGERFAPSFVVAGSLAVQRAR